MRNDILKQLYWGNLVPWEFRPDDSELAELSGKIDADITALKSGLSEEEREILERLLSNLSTLESKQICQGYVNGFKHGSLMMLEVLSPDKQP